MNSNASKRMATEGSALKDLRENAKQVKDDVKSAMSDDKPLDKHAPGATFSLVFLSYMVALLLLLLAIGVVYWLAF